jgi:hypothetical protein
MFFEVSPSVSLDNLAVGRKIHFSMVKEVGTGWIIDEVHAMGDTASGEDSGHD